MYCFSCVKCCFWAQHPDVLCTECYFLHDPFLNLNMSTPPPQPSSCSNGKPFLPAQFFLWRLAAILSSYKKPSLHCWGCSSHNITKMTSTMCCITARKKRINNTTLLLFICQVPSVVSTLTCFRVSSALEGGGVGMAGWLKISSTSSVVPSDPVILPSNPWSKAHRNSQSPLTEALRCVSGIIAPTGRRQQWRDEVWGGKGRGDEAEHVLAPLQNRRLSVENDRRRMKERRRGGKRLLTDWSKRLTETSFLVYTEPRFSFHEAL